VKTEITDLTLAAADRWFRLVDSYEWIGKDIYFLPQWYRTWEESGHGKAHCLHGKIGTLEFLYPFLINRIEDYDLPGEYFDVETAYGYGGVLLARIPSADEKKLLNKLVEEWLKDNNVVAEFMRLLPDLNSLHARVADYIPVRFDLYTDLEGLSKEMAWESLLNAKTRNMVRKAERNRLHFQVTDNLNDLFPEFVSIYLETVDRVGMDQFYYFNDSYYKSFVDNAENRILLANIRYEDQIVASSVWLLYNRILHYYLGATRNKFRNAGSSDAYLWGMLTHTLDSRVAEKIHWGGGLSLDPKDGLFRFKAKFSNRFEKVYIGKNILFPKIYDMLCEQWQRRYPGLVKKHGKKLLKYREKVL
jgi:lipid II:glycine glycyltransferase (peptidoglycan interpeptide bridge formation enzyme)